MCKHAAAGGRQGGARRGGERAAAAAGGRAGPAAPRAHPAARALAPLDSRAQPYNPRDDLLRATTMEVISTLKELLHLHPLYNEQMRNFIQVGRASIWAGRRGRADGWAQRGGGRAPSRCATS